MWTKLVVVVLLAVILGPPLRTFIWYMDWYSYSHKHHPGKCRQIKASGVGYEDFQILTSGTTFISSGLMVTLSFEGFKTYAKSKGPGSIQMIDLNHDSSETKVLPIKHGNDFDPKTFRPHGLDVIEDKVKGEHLLYVVNHVDFEADRIEKFRYLPQTEELRHEKSFFSDEFNVANDVAVLEEDKFYVTDNFYFNRTRTLAIMENLYMWKLAGVVYHDGSRATKVASGLFGANGVGLSKDKRHVYVSLLNTKTVLVYRVRRPDNTLELVQEIDVRTGVDNFHPSEDGHSLYGGCHPVMHQVVAHLMDPAKEKAPSQVIRMPLKDGLIQFSEISQEFYDQGDLISGSSVAGVYKDKMLIGSAVDTLVLCQLPPSQS